MSEVPSRWVKVEFYGLPPGIERIESVDLLAIAQKLGEAFGFEYVSGTRVQACTEPPGKALRTRR
jgi:hypothetical protein